MITLIVAVDKNWMIAKDGTIPWCEKEDLEHFREETMGSCMIMGRKTYESLPRVLKGRKHIVVTSKPSSVDTKDSDLVYCVNTVESAINIAKKESELTKIPFIIDGRYVDVNDVNVFVIGGEQVYKHFMQNNLVDRIIISKIEVEVEHNNTSKYFDMSDWKNDFSFVFKKKRKNFCVEYWQKKRNKK